MKTFNEITKYASIILILIFVLIGSILATVIYKPDLAFNFTNNYLMNDYEIKYEKIESNNNLLNPSFSLEKINIINKSYNSVSNLNKLFFKINISKSILKGFPYFTEVIVENFETDEENPSIFNNSIKIYLNNINFKNSKYDFIGMNTYLNLHEGNISVNSDEGYINKLRFKNLKIFKSISSNDYFYDGNFYFNEKDIKDNDLLNLSYFKKNKINLNVETKGLYSSEDQRIKSINKFTIRESYLESIEGFQINDIETVIYSNIDETLSGFFSTLTLNQKIKGSINAKNSEIVLRSNIVFDMDKLFDYGEYLNLSGIEKFKAKLIFDKSASLELQSNLSNTGINSNINDLNKKPNDYLKTKIFISDLSIPTYKIENKKFNVFVDSNNNGYFSLGSTFNEDIKKLNFNDGFYIFLELDELKIDNLVIKNVLEGDSNLKLIKLKINQLDFFKNIYSNQNFEINFNGNETKASFYGNNLNGTFRTDSTGFSRIDVFNTKFEFKGVNIFESNDSFDLNNINLRFVGKNIQIFDDMFQNIDFYFLRNKTLTTIDNIYISSSNINIGPSSENKKAYISYNKQNDLYKIRGIFELNNEKNLLGSLINSDFDYFFSDLNIQWVNLNNIKDLEGDIRFLIKDFESKTSLPDSPLLRTLKLFNLNALIDNINDNKNILSNSLIIDRAEGDFYIGKNRALFKNPIKFETAEAKMQWLGEILKNNDGYLEELNLDLQMRLKVSENIPWYAAILGGVPALAGGFVLENIFDDRLDDVSTLNFVVGGTINEPVINRLN
tara:strand:- start:30044 stop:32392 length:2349 start_codon:yes stop_codon:yes gene_type:complete